MSPAARRKEIAREAGVSEVSLHNHLEKRVAARLGDYSETLVPITYGHMLPGKDREATRQLSELLADGPQMAHEGDGDGG